MSRNIRDLYSRPLPSAYPSTMGTRIQQYSGAMTGALPSKNPTYDTNTYGSLPREGLGMSTKYPVARTSYPLPKSIGSGYPLPSEAKQKGESWGLPPPYASSSGSQAQQRISWRDQPPSPSFRDQPPSPSFRDHPPSPSFPNRPSSPFFHDRPSSPSFRDRPSSPSFRNRPASPSFHDQPPSPSYLKQPPSLSIRDQPHSPSFHNQPSSLSFRNQPRSPSFRNQPRSPSFRDQPPSPSFRDQPLSPSFRDQPPSLFFRDQLPSPSFRDQPPSPSFRDQPPSPSFHSLQQSKHQIRSHSRSRSKERRKRKSKSKRHSRSPDHLRGKRHRHSDSRSPDHLKASKKYRRSETPPDFSRFDGKRSKVVIDPNRIPTPPPPPILSHENSKDDSKNKGERGMKSIETSSNAKQKDSVTLSSLLEAVMETSGERKTQIFNAKMKKVILNTCETKIRKLYQKRMSGLGAFIPEPLKERWVHPQCSSLTLFHPHLTYIEGDEKTLWRYPDIPLPEVKLVNPEEIKPLKSPLSCLLDIETRKTAPVEVPPTKPVPPTKVSKPAPNPTQHMGVPPPIHTGGALPPSKPPGFNISVYPAPSSVSHHPPGPLPIMHSEPIPPPLNSGLYQFPLPGAPPPMFHPGMMHQGGPPVLQPRWQGYGGGPITYPQPPYSQNVWQPTPQNNVVGPPPPAAYPSGMNPMQNVAYPLHSYNPQRNFKELGIGNPLNETDNYGKRSPPRKRSLSPRMRDSSPSRRRTPSPLRRRGHSPRRRRTPSPLRRRTPSPLRRRTPPLRRRGPSPHKRRTPSPLRRRGHSPHRRRTPSPLRRRTPSPLRRRGPSPRRRRTPSPLRKRTPSPQRLPYPHGKWEPLPPVNRPNIPQSYINTGDFNFDTSQQILGSHEVSMPIRNYSSSQSAWADKNPSSPNKPNIKATETSANSLNEGTVENKNNTNTGNKQNMKDNKNPSKTRKIQTQRGNIKNVNLSEIVCVKGPPRPIKPLIKSGSTKTETKNSSSDKKKSNEDGKTLKSADERVPKKVQKSDNRLESDDFSVIKISSDEEEPPKHDEGLTFSNICYLGQTIRNLQEKSLLYKGIIDSLEKGDQTYTRLYKFSNSILCKYNYQKSQVVIPRDVAKEYISVLHKEYHNISKGNLLRSINSYTYPVISNLFFVVNKILKACPNCKGIPEASKTVPLVLPKADKPVEKKAQKKVTNDDRKLKSVKSNVKNLTASSCMSTPDSQLSNNGRPSGYEKATKSKAPHSKQVSSTDNKSKTSSHKNPSNPAKEDHEETNNSNNVPESASKALEPEVDQSSDQKTNLSDKNTAEIPVIDKDNTSTNKYNTPKPSGNEMSGIEKKHLNEEENITETTKESVSKNTTEENTPPENSLSQSDKTVIAPSSSVVVESTENNKNPHSKCSDTASSEGNSSVIKAVAPPPKFSEPQMDFKAQIRNAQMKTKEFHDIIIGIESKNKSDIDDSYTLKGGMLCKKLVLPDGSSGVRILAPLANVREVINIVHTMGAAHTISSKVIAFFSKHFSPVEDLENLVTDIVNKCPECNK